MRRGQRRSDGRQQPGGEVDHRTGHPEAGDQFLQHGLGVPEVEQALGPGTGRPRGGRLSKITEHGDRAGAGPPADGAQHHRRQILGLVENHVTEARSPAEQVGGLVDQDHVGERPAGRAHRSGRTLHHDQLLFLGGQDAGGRRLEELGVGQQSQDQLRRLQRRPERGRVRLDGLAAGHRVLDPVVGGVAGGLHPQQDLVGEPVRQHRPAGLVPDAPVLQLHDHLVGEVTADPPLVGTAWHHEGPDGPTEMTPDRPPQHLGHPRIALDQRGRDRVEPADRGAVCLAHKGYDGCLGGVDLAKGREYVADVGQETVVRADHEDTGSAPVDHGTRTADRPRGAARPRSSRCRARPARRVDWLSPARTMVSCSGWIVATMSRIGPVRGRSISDSRMSDAAEGIACGEVLVLVRGEPAVREAEPAAPAHAHRLTGPGLVERPRHARPPVDHHRLAARLAGDVPAADVEGLVLLGAESRVIVQPAEEERHRRIVLEALHPPVQGLLQVLGRDVIAADRLQARGVLTHPGQCGARLGQMGPLGVQCLGRFFGHARFSDANRLGWRCWVTLPVVLLRVHGLIGCGP